MRLIFLKNQDRDKLDEFVNRHPGGSLSQTFAWGEFQAAAGFKVWRLGIEDGEKLVAAATILKYDMPYGKWHLYAPRLVWSGENTAAWRLLWKQIETIGRRENCMFFRFDPLVAESAELAKYGHPAPVEIQPRNTIIVDLRPEEAEILGRMKSKWRYNVRLARRKGVTVRSSVAAADLDIFYKIAQTTAARDKFYIHTKKYYQAMLDTLAPAGFVKIFLAEWEGKVLAANLVSFYKDTATYMHGASTNENRNLMAPHLLQWEAMRAAKANGQTKYDLYGVAPAGETKHPWAGVTRFKEGWGGQRVDYPGAYDAVYQPGWYALMKLALRFKK